MKHDAILPDREAKDLDLPHIMAMVTAVSTRPRYTMLVLNLINKAAGERGRAGPWIEDAGVLVPVREWLCDAITPLAARNHKRLALVEQIRARMVASGELPDDADTAEHLISEEVRDRVRASGLTGISRAVTELVHAGLITRHYQGFRVDHENRGAQRHAVYTVPAEVRVALSSPALLI